jgi:predicted aspartyl protease
MSHRYLDTYYPAMPALEIQLGYPGESLALGPLTAIVDTGADSTLIPQSFLDELVAPFSDEARLRSHWGEWRVVSLFIVDFGLEGVRLPSVEVVGDEEGQEIILARNILNRLTVLLDGPAGQVEVR